MQILPSPVLSQIVKHFLIIESELHARFRHRIFSDGNTGMVFNYKDPLALQEMNCKFAEYLPASFIYGQLTEFRNLFSSGKLGLLIVVFQPYGMSSLLKAPAFELKNNIIDSDCFFYGETGSLSDRILHLSDPLDKIRTVENFLISKLRDHQPSQNLVMQAVRTIHLHHGTMPVTRLAAALQVSERQLQRAFEEHVGLTPKRYGSITRVNHFLKLLRHKSSETSQTSLAYDCGFYDQAHLIRELKNISGITPGQYSAQSNLLAANLVQLS